MPRGGHENEAKRRGQRATTEGEREERGEEKDCVRGDGATAQHRGRERPREAKGWWRWVNSGEILLVSGKGWSMVCAGQLASARRFNRVRVALPKNGGGGK